MLNLEKRVKDQVRAFFERADFPGADSPSKLCEWWSHQCATSYPDMKAGVRPLLGYPASNGFAERAFGKSRSVLDPYRKNN
eukprot:11578387-Karenia_brevis.AAC.1